MKRFFYIFFFGWLLLSPVYSAERVEDRIGVLESLIDRNLTYDSAAPIDSVILWGREVTPLLERQGRKELLFRVGQLVVYLHAASGNVGSAVDEARQMYEKAKGMNYDLGIALSCRAIGDAYYCSNMPDEAIDSYKEAVSRFSVIDADSDCKMMAVMKLVSMLLRKDRIKEAEYYLDMTARSGRVQADETLRFFAFIIRAQYDIKSNRLPRAYESLTEARHIYERVRYAALLPVLEYVGAKYSEATGDYETAFTTYDGILKRIPTFRKMTSINYLQLTYDKARVLTAKGMKGETCRLYQEISVITDSIVAPSYASRINNLRATYTIDRLKIDNQAEYNRILFWGILSSLCVLLFIIYLGLRIKRQNKKLAASKADLEQSRQDAEKAIRMKSLFLSNMSHEIRTPLNALSGFSQLLTEQTLDADMRRQCNDVILHNSDLLLKLVNDVIDFSNIELGQMNFNFGVHDAVVICRNVIDTIGKVKQTQAEVVFKTSLDSLELYTDDARLQQLLINLLINATKFTPQGSITLELEKESDDTALFSVTDTGCGISPEKQGQVFNRFEKLNEGAQGTGLGLSICQLIIEHIGGRIWIDPDYTDGCRFLFTHPIGKPEAGKEGEV